MSKTLIGRLVIGHRQAIAQLGRAVDSGRLHHAYLLVGPPHVGKRTLALTFAQALNCTGDPRPCGTCRPCRLAGDDSYADLRVVHRGQSNANGWHSRSVGGATAATSRSIGIEQIRALQHDAALTPYEGRWKTYVVPEAQFLTVEAANCLLKTLEEPPSHVVLILTVDDLEALLPTIVSRCRLLRLAPVPTEELEAALVAQRHVEPDQARLLARLACGRPGWAMEALADPRLLEERAARLADLLALSRGRRAERFAYAERLAQQYGRDPDGVIRALDLWLRWWRDVLLTRAGCEELVGNWDHLEELRRRARSFSVEQIRSVLSCVEETLVRLAQNVNPRLALEALLLSLPAG